MPDTDTPDGSEPDEEILPIDGHQLPPPADRPSFHDELAFLAAADPDLPGPG